MNVKQNKNIIANMINKTKAHPMTIIMIAQIGKPSELFVCGCEFESVFFEIIVLMLFFYK